MQEVFRRQEKRESTFKYFFVKSHKQFGNKIFKDRNAQYFDHLRQNRYKTRHLLLRETHRLMRGAITR